jgi:hypothetical protein
MLSYCLFRSFSELFYILSNALHSNRCFFKCPNIDERESTPGFVELFDLSPGGRGH